LFFAVLFEKLAHSLTENVLDGRLEILRIHSEFEGQVGDVRAVADGRQLPVHVRRQFPANGNFTIHCWWFLENDRKNLKQRVMILLKKNIFG
jgi:hypothetical protein